jgi:hypothetical protein
VNRACERARRALRTGGLVGRWWSRRHLATCPECAAEANALRSIEAALSIVEPLAPEHRQTWMNACRDEAPERRNRPTKYSIAFDFVKAAAALIVLGSAVWFASRPGQIDVATIHPQASNPNSIKQQSLAEIDSLRAQAARLDRDLEALRAQADMLDVRRDVERLWNEVAILDKPREP